MSQIKNDWIYSRAELGDRQSFEDPDMLFEIYKSVCDIGIKIKMTQNVCGKGCFLTTKAHVR